MKILENSGKSVNDSTKELLIQAAKKLFAAQGFEGTAVKDIADEAGVNVSLVSYYFGGKEALYHTCIELFGRERLKVAGQILKPPKSKEEMQVRLEMFMESFFQCHLDEPDLIKIIHRALENQSVAVKDIFENTFKKAFEKLVEFYAIAQQNKLISSHKSPRILAGIFYGALVHFGRLNTWCTDFFGASFTDEQFRKEVISHLIDLNRESVLLSLS